MSLPSKKTIIVTGGAGFIGSALVRFLINDTNHHVYNIDNLTYAGNLESLSEIEKDNRYNFIHENICNADEIKKIFNQAQPDAVMHLAAESHVDRSIDGPSDFLNTNVNGTYNLLEQARSYWQNLNQEKKSGFRFLHVSTDEVYGSLGKEGYFDETTAYKPNSPYSASKAASDHFVRAWFHTFGLPTVITNCSNNYGPFQFPEKLIPVIILNALHEKPIPVYGQGQNIRDWLFVEDHVRALMTVLEKGELGNTYVVGGHSEKTNIEVVTSICQIMNEIIPNNKIGKYESLITFVKDRPGHDMRYAIDPNKIQKELNWQPQVNFEQGIRKTVEWYLNNQEWCERVMSGKYRLERLGLGD